MDVSMISRMKELDEENWCLKKMFLEESSRPRSWRRLSENVVRPSQRREMAKTAVTKHGGCI